MSRFFAIALVAVLAALVTANVVVAADQTRTQTQTQQRLQDGSCCENVCDGTCPNPDCPAYQYQYQTGDAWQWAGPEDQWLMWQWMFGPWWD